MARCSDLTFRRSGSSSEHCGYLSRSPRTSVALGIIDSREDVVRDGPPSLRPTHTSYYVIDGLASSPCRPSIIVIQFIYE